MTYRLIKASLPNDWEKTFECKEELRRELKKHICIECLDELTWKKPGGDRFMATTLSDLLCTPCGCQFWVEDEEQERAA